MRQYARKKEHGHDPNDRGYDRKLEREIKRMDPAELDELLRGEEPPGTSGAVADSTQALSLVSPGSAHGQRERRAERS